MSLEEPGWHEDELLAELASWAAVGDVTYLGDDVEWQRALFTHYRPSSWGWLDPADAVATKDLRELPKGERVGDLDDWLREHATLEPEVWLTAIGDNLVEFPVRFRAMLFGEVVKALLDVPRRTLIFPWPPVWCLAVDFDEFASLHRPPAAEVLSEGSAVEAR